MPCKGIYRSPFSLSHSLRKARSKKSILARIPDLQTRVSQYADTPSRRDITTPVRTHIRGMVQHPLSISTLTNISPCPLATAGLPQKIIGIPGRVPVGRGVFRRTGEGGGGRNARDRCTSVVGLAA